ncbi:MAG: hypothetical protein ACOC1K_03295 [Nanoarchaeota archaeon]
MNNWLKHLIKSGMLGAIFSVIFMLLGAFFTTFYAILNNLDLDILNIYTINIESNGGFQVSMGPGFFFLGIILTAFFTLLFFLGKMYEDIKKNT